MKRCKKKLSVFLVLTVLLTNLVFVGSVSATSDDGIILDDNFNSYVTVSGGSGSTDMASMGYSKHKWGTEYAALEVIDGDQAVKLTNENDTIRYSLSEPLTEGMVKISYSCRFGDAEVLHGLEIQGSDDEGKQGVLAVQCCYGNTICTRSAGATDERYILVKDYVADEWYDFDIIVNLDASNYSVTVSKDGQVINTLIHDFKNPENVEITDIKYLSWRSWGQTAYIDDLKIELIDASAEVGVLPLADDFEDYITVSGGFGATDMASVGYGTHLYGGSSPTLETIDGSKALRFAGGKDQSVMYTIDDKYVPKSGKVKIAFSARYDENALVLGPEFSDRPDDMAMSIQAYDGRIVVKEPGAASDRLTLLKSYTPDEWYNFVVIVDIDSDTFDVQVSDADGKILNQIFDLDIVGVANGTKGITGLKYIDWRAWKQGNGCYIDNFFAEVTDEELPKLVKTDILDDDFESYTAFTGGSGSEYMDQNGYDKPLYAEIFATLETIDGDKAVRLSRRDGKEDGLSYVLNPAIDAVGKLRIKYSGKLDQTASIPGPELKASDNADGVFLVQVHGGRISTNEPGATGEHLTLLSSYDPSLWYDFDILIDFDNLLYSVDVSQNGSKVGGLENISLFTIEGKQLADAKSINWRNWTETENGGGYIDDLMIEYIPTAPTLSATDIKTVDVSGTAAEGLSSDKISPLTQQMILDFGCDVDASTLLGAVSLKSKNGTPVSYTGKVDGKYYIMTFDKMFDSETEYVLAVDGKVRNIYNISLGQTVRFNFKTGQGGSSAGIAGIYVGEENIKNLDTLNEGDKLTVKTNYANATNDTASVAWIITYYNGNKLIYTESVEVKDIPAGKLGIDSPEFTVKNLTDITEVCIYLWDGIETIKAYCVGETLTYSE